MRGCACRGTAGFAHVSCLAEQATILLAEAEENNLGAKARYERWMRWYACGLCEQEYHGVVRCALGWACWKTYVGRPEANWARINAMTELGNGLFDAGHHEDALSVGEAELAMARRLGVSEEDLLVLQTNLACTYGRLGRLEQALRIERDVYRGRLKLNGEESRATLLAATNYASTLFERSLHSRAKPLMRKLIPVARRVLGEGDSLMLTMRKNYARALYLDAGATLDNLREAVTTLEEVEGIARRVLGGTHPLSVNIEDHLRCARAALATRWPEKATTRAQSERRWPR